MSYDFILDGGYLPHSIIRLGIRRQLADRATIIATKSRERAYEEKMCFIANLKTQKIAIETTAANEQHYEVPTEVLAQFLGPRMKYSACLYADSSTSLSQAEMAMLESYVDKAQIEDGMSILDMGCGWGSVSLYLAERFPKSQITALSNSRTQKIYIDKKVKEIGLSNLTTITADISSHVFAEPSFDRIVAIESFEHMKNYKLLLSKLSFALRPSGKLFVHIFAHKESPYHFEDGWMSRHFFSGGTMPSVDLLLYFQDDLRIQEQWWVSGKHYARTCEDWLKNMTCNKKQLWPYLVATYGGIDAPKWYNRWQIFFMACAELFAYENGETWGVCQYLFEKNAD